MNTKLPIILVTGANGQIGTVLCQALRNKYGHDQVLASDICKSKMDNEPFVFLDILNKQRLQEILEDHKITQIYHLAAILSANGEWNPMKTWDINLNGSLSVFECAKEYKIEKVFFPSTIGVFGKTTPKTNTPQEVPLLPETVYGITKTSGELWSNYYHKKYGLDIRSLRFPGIIGHESLPAGGTTDYAVEIFHEALLHGKYTCFLAKNTPLPMIYMSDAINATLQLMEANSTKLTIRHSYNLASMSFTPEEIYNEIKAHIPNFEIEYKPDFRQAIAESWVASIDDSKAREDWGWQPKYDLKGMVADMITNLKKRLNV